MRLGHRLPRPLGRFVVWMAVGMVALAAPATATDEQDAFVAGYAVAILEHCLLYTSPSPRD